MMKTLILLVFILFLSACKDIALDYSPTRFDAGASMPISNLPLNSIYIEYPTIMGGEEAYSGTSPCRLSPELKGEWKYIEDYDGSFLRAESKSSDRLLLSNAGQYNLEQKQARQYHEHYHEHPHQHATLAENHKHNHTHENHDHEAYLGTYSRGFSAMTAIPVFPYVVPSFVPFRFFNGNADRVVITIAEQFISRTDTATVIPITTIPYENTTKNETDFIPSSVTKSGSIVISEVDDIRPRNYTIRLWIKTKESTMCIQSEPEYLMKYENMTTDGQEMKKQQVKEKTRDEEGNIIYKDMEISTKIKPKRKSVLTDEPDTYTEVF